MQKLASKQALSAGLGKPVWLRTATLFDGESVWRDAHLVYDREQVRYLGKESPPRELVASDGQDIHPVAVERTILPGLIEGHSHLFLDGAPLAPERRKQYLDLSTAASLLQRAESRLEKLLTLGIHGVREAGDRHGVGLSLQSRYRRRDSDIPYVDSPGAVIHHQGRYGSFMGTALEEHASPDACVADRCRDGAHRIKLIPTSIINFKQGEVTARPQMDLTELQAFVQAAEQHGRQSMVHASGAEGIGLALKAGATSVEHGFFITDAQLEQMSRMRTVWCPTFSPVQVQIEQAGEIGWEPSVVDNLKRIIDAHRRALQRAYLLGVPVVAGSDAGSVGVPHGLSLLKELARMQAADVSAEKVLGSATGVPAKHLAFSDKIGRIAPGFKARFVLPEADPLSSVEALQGPRITVFDGTVRCATGNESSEGL